MTPSPKDLGSLTPEQRVRLEERIARRTAIPRLPPIPRRPSEEAPLSFAQQRLWFLAQLEPSAAAYNVVGAFRLRGPLDSAALDRSLTAIVRRHESLRTCIEVLHGEPVQRLRAAEGSWMKPRQGLATSEAERDQAIRELAREEAGRPFDLAAGVLLRGTLLQFEPSDHALVLALHHIASDGWSMGILLRELGALYDADREGRPASLRDLPIQYGDYAAWQRETLRGAKLARQLTYWKEQLTGAPPVLELPTDRPRPAIQSFRGQRLDFSLPAPLARAVRELSLEAGVTPFVTLLAAFALLLQRHSGQDHVVVGSPIAGRSRSELEGLIGFFANTLALRADLSGEPTFLEMLRRLREVVLGAQEHQDLPFEKLVEELHPDRSLERNPLFQVAFAFQNAPRHRLSLSGLSLELVPIDVGTVRFDLEMHLFESEGELRGALRYATDLFDHTTAERLVAHYERLLRGAVAEPQARVSRVPILSPEEHRLVAEEWNATASRRLDDISLVHERVARQAARRPHALAVQAGDRRLLYGELETRAGLLAGILSTLGVGPEVRVGVCVEASPELVVALLAVLKAGGAYVALDPDTPASRLAGIVRDARAPLLLTHSSLLETLGDLGVPCLCVDEVNRAEPHSTECPVALPAPPCGGDNLAYVIYTSGSTGAPKGVELTHRGLANLVDWHCVTYGVTELDRATQVAGLGFDASVWEIWPYLASGASLHIPDAETRGTPAKLGRWLASEGITLSFLPTPMAEALLTEGLPSSTVLRTLLTGGDRLRRGPACPLGFELVNHYGPTENTVVATAGVVQAAGSADDRPPSIGRPITNVRAYVLDRELHPVPVGVPGELYVGGAGLARGYLGRADLTATSFLPDPFGVEPGGRLYRTGDRCRHRADGSLEFIERVDQQVKIRGHRIELGEIEAVLARHAAVREAAVVTRSDERSGVMLVAYVVARKADGAPDGRQLRNHLRGLLPEYMVPAAFVFLEALPLNASGKVDRKGLPAPAADSGDRRLEAWSPTEEILAGIFAEVTGAPHVGVDESFFDLGGHSLLATQVVARMRQALGVEVPLRRIFETPTVAGLAEAVEGASRAHQPATPPLRPAEREGHLPASFAQQRLWLLQQFDRRSSLYNVATALRLRGRLDDVALERSLAEIVDRHEALRTRFARVEGQVVQVVERARGWRLGREDLSVAAAAEGEAAVRRRLEQEARVPFDLAQGPVFRARLFRLAEQEHVLTLALHHVAADGWSLGVLVRELGTLYASHVAGVVPSLAALVIQYADFAAWQRAWLQGEVLQAQLAYWKEQLRDLPPVLELPTDHPRPIVERHFGGRRRRVLPATLADRLGRFGRSEGATLFMVLLAGFKALLARHSGQHDIVVGSPIAGRTRLELEGLIGFFANTLVLRADLSDDPSFRQLVARVRDGALGAYAHQDVPFEKLVEELRPERVLGHHPLFQAMFVLQNAPRDEFALPGLEVAPEAIGDEAAKFDLLLMVTPTADGLVASLTYDRDLFEAETADRLLAHYQGLLEGALDRPHARLSKVDFLLPSECSALAAWNLTDRAYPQGECLHDLIARSARERPAAVAIEHVRESLTYFELESRANRLAHRLQALGVGPEIRVGVCLERSLDLVVALLAVLKAGGAYVPLDPAYPKDRVAFMLEDSGVHVLVTRASLQARLPEVGQTTLCLEHEKGLIDRLSALPPASGALSENLAYVIYTSGSTGRPKGVAITHASAVALAHWALEAIGGEDLDGVAAGTSICFDLSVFELFVPLAHGGRVVLLENALALGELAPSAGVRLVNSVPSAVAQLLRTKGLPRSVRTVCLAGEPLSTGLVQQIHAGSSAERVFDLYGPSEDTTYSTFALRSPKGPETIGRPIANTRAYVLDRFGARVPVGAPGELALAGEGLARAYLGRPDLTAEKFVPDEWSGRPGARLYRTGDRARFLSDGRLEYLGRLDHQVKIRGFRIEPGEVEAVLGLHPAVDEVLVLAREDTPGDKRLVAYVAPRSEAGVPAEDLREHLRARVPEHMVPSAFVLLDRLPRTPNGKVDRKQLPAPAVAGRGSAKAHLYSASETEKAVAAIFAEALRVAGVGPEENFFDLGGHSLLLLDVHERLKVRFPELNLGIVDLFRYPTVAALAGHLAGNQASAAPRPLTNARRGALQEPVAIIGLSGRFPGAANVHELWRNLREGRETVTFFGEEELRRAGVAEEVLRDPRYVRARGVLEGAEEFAAEFFGYSPREAQVMDPQQRVFLECAWDALENAGYDALRFSGLVGVYAGANISSYLLQNLSRHPHLLGEVGGLQAKIGNDKDSLATRVSYELNLRGPSLGVQTACSTSLVAVHLAALALRNGECDMALAGGVSIGFPQVTGYLYQDEGILSPDGHCRAFGAAAAGTVPGSGVGVVVLKRLEDARRDGDTIRAVIRGSAINNDGSVKVGYTAPSVSGQAEVIARALAAAGVPASRIGYVEAHGTGTRLGDPVEVEALTQAFRAETERRSFCALGSLKSNFGHLDTAAGVAGLIKAVLSLERREIFPSLHAETASPRIAFDESPFYVSRSPTPWVSDGPRYAAVSSFGIGGTNAHVVLEEAPAPPAPTPGRAMHILPLSARTPTALAAAAARLLGHLDTHEDQALADVAYTLQVGRKTFPHRQAVMCRDVSEARTALQGRESSRVVTGMAGSTPRPVAFLFPGQGAQHAGMGAELYQSEPVYRTEMDRCLEALRGHLSVDLKDLLFPRPGEEREADRRLGETQLTQPAIFATNWALARLWSSYGVTPVALLGHSVGEYVAACLADVLDLEDALRLVVERGRLLQSLPPGAMVALGVGEEEAAPLLGDALCLAAVNAKDQCVVAGPVEAVDDLEDRLLSRGVDFRRLATSHAFHSQMVEPVVGLFPKLWNGVRLRAPRIPYLSNLTGGWITAADATDPGYWARQMRGTVRFAECLDALLADGPCALLEAGPGRTLTQLVRRHPAFTADHVAFSSLGRGVVGSSESEHMTESLARLWTAGIDVDWTSLHAGAERRRVPLPGYPFERKRYFVDPGATRASVSMVAKRSDTRSWFYAPVWKSSPSPRLVRCREDDTTSFATLVFAEASGPGLALAARLAAEGKFSTVVRPGSRFEEGAQGFSIRPTAGEDYDALLSALAERGGLPARIIHAWSAIPSQAVAGSAIERFERAQERGFSSVFHLLRALARRPSGPEGCELVFVGAHMHDVTGAEPVFPEGLPALALGRVAAQELADLRFRGVDLEIPPNGQLDSRTLEALADECIEGRSGTVVALRGGRRWVQQFEPLDAPPIPGAMPRVRDGGVYVVTGGLGEIGLEVAQRLAQLAHVRLVLIGRRVPPPCERWTEWLETHGAEEATSRIILKLREIEARGAELLVCAADVADRDAMRSALGEARSRWGGIQGVVHAAGTPRGASIAPLAELSPDHSREQFRSKALGVYVLEELLRTDDLDFCLLMSSLSTVLGGLGMGAYAAANLFMEGFAAGQFRSGREAWGSVSWDGWRLREELMKAASGPAAALALSREEGQDVFERLLRMRPLPQVVVSTADLEARRTRWVTTTGEILREEAPAHEPAGRHPRPELGSQFVAARNPTERTIAEIWEGLLGVARVGIHDDFFELGGHSLLATRLTTRLRETFGAEIPLRAIFESPTVEGLANRVLADAAEPGQAQRVAEMLERLRGMSPEQKRRLLEQEKQARGQAT